MSPTPHEADAIPRDRSAGTVRRCLCASDAHPPARSLFPLGGFR
nr:MAG TPA: hypothetical protein [Caudoviricetes sp.]